jgi:hypothetical protein
MAAVLLALSPHPVPGRVVRIVGHDTVAVPGAHVTLHRVTATAPGPVDSTLSDPRGRFTFSVPSDSGVVYLVSARWAGIEYFATPFVVHAEPPYPSAVVVVSDTSSTIAVKLIARHLIVAPAAPDGTRDVVDLFVLDNPGPATRVAGAAQRPTWRAHLPRFAMNVHGGNSDFAADAVQFSTDEVALFAAIPPGQRDVEVDYQIPANSKQFELPVDEDAPISNIVSADKSLRVRGAFTRSDTVIDNKPYARWQGSMSAGESVVLVMDRTGTPPWLIPVLVGAMGLVLVGVTVRTLR